MRTTNTKVGLLLVLVSGLFVACAPEVEYGSENSASKMAGQPVAEAECIGGTLPASGCLDYGEIKMQTYEACEQAGLQLVVLEIVPVAGCDNQTSGVANYQCCPAQPPAPAPTDPGGCTKELLDFDTCQTHADLKMASFAACEQNGLVLVDYYPDSTGCAEGEGKSVVYLCAGNGSSCYPPSPPNTGVCTKDWRSFDTCQTLADLKLTAMEACEQNGLILTGLIPESGGCADGEGLSMVFLCGSDDQACPTLEPPPPSEPGVCVTETLTFATCQTYSDLKMATWEACDQSGGTLVDLDFEAGGCADGEAISASYTCLSGGNYCP